MDAIKRLEKQLGYVFCQRELLMQALTHRSAQAKHNERLEFLGDAVVNLVIAEALYEKFPKEKEGILSRLRANLVKGEALAELGRAFDLGEYILLGPGEKKSAGHKRDSILAGCIEAIIGAIYLDADFQTAKSCILQWHQVNLANISPEVCALDHKTQLQEWLQGKKYDLPNYQVVDTTGKAHQQTFKVICDVGEVAKPCYGVGSSRRKAEQAAAAAMLKQLNHASC